MQSKLPSGTAFGGSCARVCRAKALGFQTAQRGETAASWLVSCALVAGMSLFAAQVLFHSRILF